MSFECTSQIWVRLLLKLTLSWLPRLHFWQFCPPLCSSGGEQLIRALATAEQAEKHNRCDYCLRSRWYLAQKCRLQCPRSRGWSSLRSLRHTKSQRKSVSLLLCRRESNFWLHWRRLCFLTMSQQSQCCFESFSKYICSIEWTWSSVKQIYWKLFGNRHTNSFTKLVSEIEK